MPHRALQVFVQCNEEEMESFIAGELDEALNLPTLPAMLMRTLELRLCVGQDLGDALQMEYEEFELAFLKFTSLMLTMPQKSSKKRTFTQAPMHLLCTTESAPPSVQAHPVPCTLRCWTSSF